MVDDEDDDEDDEDEDDEEGRWAALRWILRGATQPHTRAFPLPFAPDTPDLDDGTICEVAVSASGMIVFNQLRVSLWLARALCES